MIMEKTLNEMNIDYQKIGDIIVIPSISVAIKEMKTHYEVLGKKIPKENLKQYIFDNIRKTAMKKAEETLKNFYKKIGVKIKKIGRYNNICRIIDEYDNKITYTLDNFDIYNIKINDIDKVNYVLNEYKNVFKK